MRATAQKQWDDLKFRTVFAFSSGMVVCVLLFVGLGYAGLPRLAGWLVVDSVPESVDAVVVLGGGNGSRFRKAVELSTAGGKPPLVLVDRSKADWQKIASGACETGSFDGRQVVCLEGSTSTLTDAEITLKFAREQNYKKILVVTDPYHSRRAQLIFTSIYAESDIETNIVNSGYYGKYRPPETDWWQDEMTLQTVWVEFGKIIYFALGDWFYGIKKDSALR